MTRAEAIQRLEEIKKQMVSLTTYKELGSLRYFCLIHEEATLEKCLKAGIDPDSVWFHFDVDDGKGIKWK